MQRKLYIRLGFVEKGKMTIEGYGGEVPIWNFSKEVNFQM